MGRVEVKAPEESGRGKESANTCTLASIQRGTLESPGRQLVYRGARFFVLLEIKVISGYISWDRRMRSIKFVKRIKNPKLEDNPT